MTRSPHVATGEVAAPPTLAGTTFEGFGGTVGVWVTDGEFLDVAEGGLRTEVAVVDLACSRFREDSWLVAANRNSGIATCVPPELVEAVTVALEMAAWTEGWYDPTVGQAVVNAGYDRDFADMPQDRPEGAGPPAPSGRWREVIVDPVASTVTVPHGCSLDLGGSAKGWAADRAVAAIRGVLGDEVGVLVSAGGDLAAAGPAPAGGWPVRLSRSVTDDRSSADYWFGITEGAMATSGATLRRWRMAGEPAHHLIDPWTGRPATSPWRSVTVHADRAVVADVGATAGWLMGRRAPEWLEDRHLSAILVPHFGSTVFVGEALKRRGRVPE